SNAQEARQLAKVQVEQTQKAEQQATVNAATAVKARSEAEEKARAGVQAAYQGQMRLAERAAREGETARLLLILQEWVPLPGQIDSRDKRWYDLLAGVSFKGHTGGVRSVCYSFDGKRVLSGSGDKTLKVWDAETGLEIRTLQGHAGAVNSVCFSPN